MNNREKYHFEDFTFDNYRNLVKIAVNQGFNFISYTDETNPVRKEILWRHDVEFEPDIALTMAEIESENGAKGTYFFQLHSQLYNLFDIHYRNVFHKIRDLGHFVGLHFDCRYWGISDEKQLDKYISLDREYMEQNLGVRLNSFSFHNTTPFTQSCLKYRYGGLINVYSSFFKENYSYCGDSLGYWRFDRLEDVLMDESVTHLQALTHDANWQKEVLSPRKRFAQTMYRHAERLIEQQISGLHSKGMLCPDDDED